MKYDIRDIKRIILYTIENNKVFMEIVSRDTSRHIMKFEDYITPCYALEELMKELKSYMNSTRIGYLFARTATYDILQLFDSDDETDYLSAQLYLKDRIKLDEIWKGDRNKNFFLERMMVVTDKKVPKTAPTIYFNIC